MALNSLVGSITQPGSTGTQSTSLPADFDPKFIFMRCVARAANGGGSGHAVHCIGMATDRGGTASQRYNCFASEDNIGTADVYAGNGTADIIVLTNGTTATVDLEVAFVEFVSGASSAFVVDWQNLHTTASIKIDYWVVGGSDVEDALVTSYSNTGTGVKDITVASGFGQPDLLFFPVSWNGADPPATVDEDAWFGFARRHSVANGRGIRWGSDDAATTQATNHGVFHSQAVHNGSLGTSSWVAVVNAESGWPTDGFELNVTTWGSGGTWPIPYAALRFSSDVSVNSGNATAPVTAVTQDLALGAAGTPKFAMVLGVRHDTANATDNVGANCAMWGIGFMDGDGNQRFAGGYDDDGQATASVCGTMQTDAKLFQYYLPSTNALDAEADGVVDDANDRFQLSWTDPAPGLYIYEWLTVGVAAAAAAEIPSLHMAPFQGAF